MDIICQKCNSVNQYTTELKAHNLVATCSVCKSFIKNLPQKAPTIFFGKYKGKLVEEVQDLNYLQWMLDKNAVKGHVKAAVISQIEKIKLYGS